VAIYKQAITLFAYPSEPATPTPDMDRKPQTQQEPTPEQRGAEVAQVSALCTFFVYLFACAF
jgi:hypothetical protein